MKVMGSATEEEMVASFLRAEISSVRWARTILSLLQQYGLNRQLIDAPDLENVTENVARATILGDYRGYGQGHDLFQDYPPLGTVRWQWVALSGEDVAQVRYIDYSYWNELSDRTRLATVAAENIRRGVVVFGVSNDGFWQAAIALMNGVRFPELILVRSEETSPVVLEGHLRLTAYLLAPEETRTEVMALLGTAPGFADW
jgi:pimeloyl-ACP methyl ester carboxylesterase